MINKKAFEFSFSWLFAIIVGAAVIFLAVYAINQFIGSEKTKQDAELGKELGILLTPIETGLETGKITKITMPLETRISNDCSSSGTFGSQKISTSTKSLTKKYDSSAIASSFQNKYIFSEETIEGKDYLAFSKPLLMPFKIANLIYLWPSSEEFCFVNPPKEVEEEFSNLQINVAIALSTASCSKSSKKVCFTSSGCDIDVSLDSSGKIKGSLKKKSSDRVYFESSALLYSAIFSDSKIYECQLKRLMKRASELSWVYYGKSLFVSQKGCSSNLELELAEYANKTFSLNSSLQLREISSDSETIRRKNNDLSCRLF